MLIKNRRFSKLQAKTLYVGEDYQKEKVVMRKSAKDIVEGNSNCTGVILPNIGHGISLAMPDFFNHIVEGWIHEGNLPNEC